MIVLRLSLSSPARAEFLLNEMVVSLGRSRMLIMRNQIGSNQINNQYFQIEQDDNQQMTILQKKLVVMMEDLKHYHFIIIILTHLSKYNS